MCPTLSIGGNISVEFPCFKFPWVIHHTLPHFKKIFAPDLSEYPKLSNSQTDKRALLVPIANRIGIV